MISEDIDYIKKTKTMKIRLLMMKNKIGDEFSKSEFYVKCKSKISMDNKGGIVSYNFTKMEREGSIVRKYPGNNDIYVRMLDIEILNIHYTDSRYKKKLYENIKIDTSSDCYKFSFGGINRVKMTSGVINYG